MRPRPLRFLQVLLAFATAVAPRVASAQWLRVNPGGGEVGVEARDDQFRSGGRSAASNVQLSQWLSVPLSGVLISPQIASYSLSIRPTWGQQTVTGQSARYGRRSVGLGGSVTILPSALLSLGLNADRTTGGSDGGPGTSTRNASRAGGGSLRLRSTAFPIVAEWHSRSTSDTWQATSYQPPIYRDETLRSLRITGQSSKLKTSFERLRFEDRVGGLGFSSVGGYGLHALSWGKGSNLQTLLETLDRAGREGQRRRSLSERLFLQHTTALATEYIVDGRKNAGTDGTSDELSTSALMHYRPREGMTAGLRAMSAGSVFATGRVGRESVAPSLRIEAKLPGGAQLMGAMSAGYERISQQIPSESWIQVVDEPHTVGASRVLELSHERADGDMIKVYNAGRTIAYIQGIDFRVSMLGSLVRIEVPLASRIAVGDAVVVSYRYQALSEGQYEVRSGEAFLSLVMGGFSLTPSASTRRGRSLSGPGGARADEGIDRLSSGDDFVLAAGFHRPTRIGQIDLDVARRVREGSTSDYSIREVRAGYQPRPLGALRSSVGTSVSHTHAPGQDVRAVMSNATLYWSLTDNAHVQASRESWRWAPRGFASEETVIWNVQLGWVVGRVEAEFSYLVQRRAVRGADDNQRRLFGRFVRRF